MSDRIMTKGGRKEEEDNVHLKKEITGVQSLNSNTKVFFSNNEQVNDSLAGRPIPQKEQGDAELTTIQKFYSGANILVTGATGFMGKVLIEKLLRSCPDIENIYMLVREKRGKNTEERVEDLISSRCFLRIKKEYPEFRFKIHAITGDISLMGLGINEADRCLLQYKVDIVFHIAATVRFDEPLQRSIIMNVRGTREILNLCRTFRSLKSVVHVSTAYSNTPLKEIGECLYDAPFSSEHMIRMAETLSMQNINSLSNKLVGDWPNNYSFTKGVSEDAVKRYGQGLPISVFRPSIVIWTHKEPMAGWTDSLSGPTGMVVAGGTGFMRAFQCNTAVDLNIVPCDMAINAMIASAWDAQENKTRDELPVYNYTASRDNTLTLQRYIELSHEFYDVYPPSWSVWYPFYIFTGNVLLCNILRLLLHYLPALLIDCFLLATTGRTKMIGIYKKIDKLGSVISYFACHEWLFQKENVDKMWTRLEKRDRELFPFDTDSLDWYRYFRYSMKNLRWNTLNDHPDTLDRARVRWQRLYILHRAFQCFLACTAFWIFLQSLPHLQLLWHRTVDRLWF